jgi:hypothetical protein
MQRFKKLGSHGCETGPIESNLAFRTQLTISSLDVDVDPSLQIAEAFHVPQKCRSLTRPTATNTAFVGLRTTKIAALDCRHDRDLKP